MHAGRDNFQSSSLLSHNHQQSHQFSQDLIQDGLFTALAFAFYTPPFRHVASCLVARELGAVDIGTAKARRTLAMSTLVESSRSLKPMKRLNSKSTCANVEVEAMPTSGDASSSAVLPNASVMVVEDEVSASVQP